MSERQQPGVFVRNALVAGSEGVAPNEPDALTRFLEALAAHGRGSAEPAGQANDRALALDLGLALLGADRLRLACPQLLPQLALLGPTQAGKSSLANAVLGATLAEVSPLAGFTVHPQGFAWGQGADDTIIALEPFFHPLQRRQRQHLTRDHYDCFTTENVSGLAIRPPIPAGCLWDTPDFDSVDAESYRRHVLRIAALADLAILVLSKDKYSDQSVWDLVALLEPLGLPSVIVLNKIDERARGALIDSLGEKWRGVRRDSIPAILTVPFIAGDGSGLPADAVAMLGECIARHAARTDRVHRRPRTRAFIAKHWSDWLVPVRAEQKARAEWDDAIEGGIDEVLACYQRDYLNHPHHYETFQRALARLLTLLEVPGVAGVIAAARRALTWPFRQASALGRRRGGRDDADEAKSGEQVVLQQLMEHLMLKLQQVAWAKREQDATSQAWWGDLGLMLRSLQKEFDAQLQSALAGYTDSFQTEIDQTARALYQRLESRPVVLNSLRATRITTDAAALALALHSGGIGIQDFVIAPATLSLTSMLTEGALGRYVNRAADELKVRQLEAVNKLLRETLGRWLQTLPERLDGSKHLKVSDTQLAHVEKQLAAYG